MQQFDFNNFAENCLICIDTCSIIIEKYKRILHLGKTFKYINDSISVFHRVPNENHDLCIEFIKKIIIKIQENMQFCLDEYNSNTTYTSEQMKLIYDIIHIMDNLKFELEKISPLDFIIEINNNQEEEQEEGESEEEYEFGPYDSLNGSSHDNCILCYDYDGFDGYDN